LRRGLDNFLPGIASKHHPLDLYLPSIWDYRHEPLHPVESCFRGRNWDVVFYGSQVLNSRLYDC
jgi:hypothetical protein